MIFSVRVCGQAFDVEVLSDSGYDSECNARDIEWRWVGEPPAVLSDADEDSVFEQLCAALDSRYGAGDLY